LQSRTAEHHDGRSDPLLILDQFGLEKFEADADGTEFIPLEKLRVLVGRDIGGGFCCGVK
jgi:hypothetical protein